MCRQMINFEKTGSMSLPLRRYVWMAALSLAGTGFGCAQTGNFHGTLLDAITGRAIDYGIVYNYSRNINIYSTPSGEFTITALPGDTLVVSALGYYYAKAVISDSLLQSGSPVAFRIEPRAYEIEEARIVSLGTYEEFRQNFIHLDKPKTATEKLAENLAIVSREVAKEAFAAAQVQRKSENGITIASFPIRTPEEKERIRLAEIVKKEKVRDQVYAKYNPAVVKKVTGLEADDEVIEFMQFCDFSDDYLMKVNEYDLMAVIQSKYRAFKARKQAGDEGNFLPDPMLPAFSV
jgi:hypothetical protein